ncbi:hypothetical protein VTN77DRAFT_2281 [Rasamsonia byssochlamydoides]|uniref:uncharacterized protein n=1 Tax=Rasamsonia byssochlamydoides TaxID=89139 RepID=UPI0037430198
MAADMLMSPSMQPFITSTATELPFPTSILVFTPVSSPWPPIPVPPLPRGSITSAPVTNKMPEFALIIVIVLGTIVLVSLCTFFWMIYRRKVRSGERKNKEQDKRREEQEGNTDEHLWLIPRAPEYLIPIRATVASTSIFDSNIYTEAGPAENLTDTYARNLLLEHMGLGTSPARNRPVVPRTFDNSSSPSRTPHQPAPQPVQTSRTYDSVVSSILNRYAQLPHRTDYQMGRPDVAPTNEIELSDITRRGEHATSLESERASPHSRRVMFPQLGTERGLTPVPPQTPSTVVTMENALMPRRHDYQQQSIVTSNERENDPNYYLQPRVYRPEATTRRPPRVYEQQSLPDLVGQRHDETLVSEHYPYPVMPRSNLNEGHDAVAFDRQRLVENYQHETYNIHGSSTSRGVDRVATDMEANLRPPPLTLRKSSSQSVSSTLSAHRSETPYCHNCSGSRPNIDMRRDRNAGSSSTNVEEWASARTTVQAYYPGCTHAHPPSSTTDLRAVDDARDMIRQASREYFEREMQRLRHEVDFHAHTHTHTNAAASTTQSGDDNQDSDFDLPIQNFDDYEESLVDPALATMRITAAVSSTSHDGNNNPYAYAHDHDDDNSEVTINPRGGRHLIEQSILCSTCQGQTQSQALTHSHGHDHRNIRSGSYLFTDNRIPNRFASATNSRDVESMMTTAAAEGICLLSPSNYSRFENETDTTADDAGHGFMTVEDVRRCIRLARQEAELDDDDEDDENED